jgi:hypothetical protein
LETFLDFPFCFDFEVLLLGIEGPLDGEEDRLAS